MVKRSWQDTGIRQAKTAPREWGRTPPEDGRYAAAAGRISILEMKLLTEAELALFAAGSTDTAQRHNLLDKAGYPKGDGLEERILLERDASDALLSELDRPGILSRVLFLEQDYHNMRSFLKGVVLEPTDEPEHEPVGEGRRAASVLPVDHTDLPAETVRLARDGGSLGPKKSWQLIRGVLADPLEKEAETEEVNGTPDTDEPSVQDSLARDVGLILRRYRERREIVVIDLLADQLLYLEAWRLAQPKNAGSASPFLLDFVSLNADAANLQTLARSRRRSSGAAFLNEAMVPGGTVSVEQLVELYDADEARLNEAYRGSLASALASLSVNYYEPNGVLLYTQVADNLRVRLALQGRSQRVSADRVGGFWLSREMEISNLRIMLTGLEQGISDSRLMALARYTARRGRT